MYPPGHQYLPLGPRLSTPRPQGTPVLTTPRPPTHAMLTRQGSLQSGKVNLSLRLKFGDCNDQLMIEGWRDANGVL